MKLHANARTCPHSRRLAVSWVDQQGWTLAAAAEAAGREAIGRGAGPELTRRADPLLLSTQAHAHRRVAQRRYRSDARMSLGRLLVRLVGDDRRAEHARGSGELRAAAHDATRRRSGGAGPTDRRMAGEATRASPLEEPLAPNEVASSRPERVGVAGRPKREEAAARASRSPTGAQCSTEAS
jgi:hypothetical protein